MNIKEIRAKFPQYSDLSDRELLQGIHRRYYSDMPLDDFLKRTGFNERQTPPIAGGVDPAQGMGTGEQLLAGVGQGMTELARGAGQRLGMVSQEAVDEAARLDAPLKKTAAGATGAIAGKVAASVPTMFVPGANTLAGATMIGAGMGALEPTQTGQSVGANMAMGGAGGALGQAAGQLIGRAIRPVASQLDPVTGQLAQSARARGIPLDAADLTGSRPLTTMRDVLSQMPLTADRQGALQGAKQAAFNKAVAGTFGASDDALTPTALQAARDRLGQQFTDLASRNVADVSDDALTRIGAVIDDANRYGTPDVARVVSNFADDILSRADAAGKIPGQAYRALDSQMGRVMRTTANGDLRHAVGQLRDALRQTMDESISGADQAAWQQARRQYANLMTVAPLAARSETGDVSGRALLAAALRQNKGTPFSGAGELGELGRIGKAFIAEQTPNSGTAQRLFMQRFVENPIAASWNQAVGGISLPMQALINSPAGQRYFSQGLMPITPGQRALANALMRGTGAALIPPEQE